MNIDLVREAYCEAIGNALGGNMDSDELWRYLSGVDDLYKIIIKKGQEKPLNEEKKDGEPHGRYL